MSFTAEVKEELSRVDARSARAARRPSSPRSSASRARCTSSGNGRFRLEVATETAPVARKTIKLLHELYGLKTELTVRRSVLHKSNNYLITVGSPAEARRRAARTSASSTRSTASRTASPAELVRKDCCAISYLRGAFLGGGFVADPHGDFHFELTAETERDGRRTSSRSWRASRSRRRSRSAAALYAVYLKGAEPIVTFLALVGAHRALLRTEDVRIIKSMRNDVNRLVNAETANLQKSADAAMEQVEDIRRLVGDARAATPAAGAAGARRAAARVSRT